MPGDRNVALTLVSKHHMMLTNREPGGRAGRTCRNSIVVLAVGAVLNVVVSCQPVSPFVSLTFTAILVKRMPHGQAVDRIADLSYHILFVPSHLLVTKKRDYPDAFS